MVGIVVVSHSADLARAAVDLALQMVNGPAPRIEIAAGTADERLGTDAARVAQAVEAADDGEGVVVIMDLGSAILSAELALESSCPSQASRLVLSRLRLWKASLLLSFQRPAVLNSTLSPGMQKRHSRPSWRSLIRHS